MNKIIWLLILAAISAQSMAQEPSVDKVKVGDVAPVFTIQTIDGQLFDLAQLKGKVVYINFFATWCGPCQKELPYVEQEIWQSIKNPNFVMLVIGREHTPEELMKFRSEKGFTFPMAADTKREVFNSYATQNIPRNLIIDKEGNVVYFKHGFTEEEFKEMVTLLKGML
jgi:peroxiredoxin